MGIGFKEVSFKSKLNTKTEDIIEFPDIINFRSTLKYLYVPVSYGIPLIKKKVKLKLLLGTSFEFIKEREPDTYIFYIEGISVLVTDRTVNRFNDFSLFANAGVIAIFPFNKKISFGTEFQFNREITRINEQELVKLRALYMNLTFVVKINLSRYE